ncbi:MAG: hypothetical protein FJ034_02740, partial [Chloroflexi bacterium]|nr:hypothetical protein [Chloroflexota bacterium]
MPVDRFDAISPLDFRYIGGDAKLHAALAPYLSENGYVTHKAEVEGHLAKALADAGAIELAVAERIAAVCANVDPAAVAEEERKTRHDVRALVNVIVAKLPPETGRFVHLGATSYDIVDTANSLRYRRAIERVVLPRLGLLAARLIRLAENEADTPQIGRTHGRHAEPITFGFAMAEYVARVGGRVEALRAAAAALPGKLSGAVGAYNALSLLVRDPRELERAFLARAGVRRGGISTQIVEPEGWTDLAHACVTAMGVMANLADDLRNLQRTEIAEITEAFVETQVGSSTMPHKRNPISFENVKSMWKVAAPRVMTTYLDQISDHQRDLTNSGSQRFLAELVAILAYCAGRLADSLEGIRVDRDKMKANLNLSRGQIAAEPLYVLLAKHGQAEAHELVRRLTLEAERGGVTVLEVAMHDDGLRQVIAKLTPDERRVLERPEEYRGLAGEVARDVARTWRARLAGIMPEHETLPSAPAPAAASVKAPVARTTEEGGEAMSVLVQSDVPGATMFRKGKVRDVYEVG